MAAMIDARLLDTGTGEVGEDALSKETERELRALGYLQ